MKFLVLTVLAFALSVGTATADPIFGTWKSKPESNGEYAHIEIKQCGSVICGFVTRTFTSAGEVTSPIIGKKIVWDLEIDGNNKYSGGQIWRYSDGKTYGLKMSLRGNSLDVKGCVLGLCRSGGTWKRVP